MATDFADLGLDYDTVRQDLFELGIIDSVDDTTYSEGELANLMFVANLALEHSIDIKAAEVEALLVDFQLQSYRLEGLTTVFAGLRDLLTPADGLANVGDLVDYLGSAYRLIDLESASAVSIDYSFTYNSNEDPVTFDNVQEFLAAVEDNTVLNDSGTTFLQVVYSEYEGQGLFDGIVRSDGVPIQTTAFAVRQVLEGNAYMSVTQSDPAAPDVYLDGDGFQQYVIAKMLQDEGHVGADVYVEPITYANSSQPSLAGLLAEQWIDWHKLYFGALTVAADSGADTLTVDYNGVAGLAEMGVSFPQAFESVANSLEISIFFSDDDFTYPNDPSIPRSGVNIEEREIELSNDEAFLGPFADEDNWLVWLTAIAAYGNAETMLYASDFASEVPTSNTYDGTGQTEEEYLVSLVLEEIGWSTLDEAESVGLSVGDYLEGSELNRLIENSAVAIESEAALGEVALLEVNTAITEWSELHSSWDTIHKYTTDAAERAIAAMK